MNGTSLADVNSNSQQNLTPADASDKYTLELSKMFQTHKILGQPESDPFDATEKRSMVSWTMNDVHAMDVLAVCTLLFVLGLYMLHIVALAFG
jgi:hypothetical protein